MYSHLGKDAAYSNSRTRVRAMDFEMNIRYAENSLSIDSEEMKQLQSCAAENNIVVCIGHAERKGSSLYIGQCTIDNTGELVMSRRKLKPVHMERTLFGDGDGPSLNNVATTGVGKVGQLSCAVSTLQALFVFTFDVSILMTSYHFRTTLTHLSYITRTRRARKFTALLGRLSHPIQEGWLHTRWQMRVGKFALYVSHCADTR
jgi:hypothetical protein